MALGFQDCCNSSNYFYLNGIPATVSEFETYYIITSQGEKFCATYVDVPALNYQPPTYTLLEMTEYTDCDDCKTSNSYTCPTSELILVGQGSSNAIAVSDCRIVTIMPLYVECASINPTFVGQFDGSLRLFVTGGTQPYTFYSAGTTNVVGNNTSIDNIFPIFQNLDGGTYSITVVDSVADFITTITCILDPTPPALVIACLPTGVTINGASNGALNLQVSSGIPPYTFEYLGNPVTLPLENLSGGYYDITVIDSGVGEDKQIVTQTCLITEPAVLNYPTTICMRFTLCGTQMYLSFDKDTANVNFRPYYICTNPDLVGLVDLGIFYGDNGWQTTEEVVQTNPIFSTSCGISYIGQTFFGISYSPTSPFPMGNWYTNQGGVLTGVAPVYVSSGACPVSVQAISIGTYCSQTPLELATVVLEANGGTAPYIYYIVGGSNPSSTSPIFSLPGGTYSAIVQDALGTGSQVISFVVPTSSGVDVLFGIDACVNSNLTTNWLNQISGPSANPVIQAGESRELNATMNSLIDFSFLPDGAEFTGRIKILFSSYFTGGDVAYNTPSTSNIIVTPTITAANIQTNGVGTNYMSSVTPTLISNPGQQFTGTNGIWFKTGGGSTCCSDNKTQGNQWYQSYEWISPILTFNNTTVLTNIFSIYTKNAVPYLNSTCTNGSFCGAYLTNSVVITLQDLVKVTGCINVNGTKKIVQATVKNNSDADAGWVTQPIPC